MTLLETSFFELPYVVLILAIIVLGIIHASMWKYSDFFEVTRSDGTIYDLKPTIKSVAILLLTLMALIITCQRLAPTFWNVWGWSGDFWLLLVLSIVTLIALHNGKSIVFFMAVIAVLILGVVTLPEAYSESKRIQNEALLGHDSNTNSNGKNAHLSEVEEIMAQQDRMNEYYGTFKKTAGPDTSTLLIPSYSILNIIIPVGTKLSITNGNNKHYLYDGYDVTGEKGEKLTEEEKPKFRKGNTFYKMCNPKTIDVTYIVSKMTKEQIQEALKHP